MLNNFQLAAIVNQGAQQQLLRIPLHQDLQRTLAGTWTGQLEAFAGNAQEIAFNPGYHPEQHELFRLEGFQPPAWLAGQSSATVRNLNAINTNDALVTSIRSLVAFARDDNGAELVLFQNFSRSHVISPGRFLFLQGNTYETTERPGLALDDKLSALYVPADGKLLFHNFRTVNTFLPLADLYEDASEEQIRDVLGHELLAPENVDVTATEANQWFRKRFAMLKDSGVLDEYSAKQIKARSKGYDVEIKVSKGRIVFPADRSAAKKLLQFLNEELYRGAITETLYETNSKREAD